MSLRYVILSQLEDTKHTGYSVTKAINDAGYWNAVVQQSYRELKKLLADNLIEEAANTNAATNSIYYQITNLGRQALIEWLSSSFVTAHPKDLVCIKLKHYHLAPERIAQSLELHYQRVKAVVSQLEKQLIALSNEHLIERLIVKKQLNENKATLIWFEEVKESLC